MWGSCCRCQLDCTVPAVTRWGFSTEALRLLCTTLTHPQCFFQDHWVFWVSIIHLYSGDPTGGDQSPDLCPGSARSHASPLSTRVTVRPFRLLSQCLWCFFVCAYHKSLWVPDFPAKPLAGWIHGPLHGLQDFSCSLNAACEANLAVRVTLFVSLCVSIMFLH